MSSGWDRFRSVDDVRFRAACNDAVPESRRPIKPRVMRRVGEDTETAGVWSDVVARGPHRQAAELEGGPTSPQCDAFFADLVADRRWRQLVVEYVDAERRWSELWSGRFEAFKERLKAFLEKSADPSCPIPRGAAVGLLTLTMSTTYLVTLGVEAPPRISIPIELQGPADRTAMSIRLDQPPAATFPVTFVPSAGPLSLRVDATLATSGPDSPLTQIATDLRLGSGGIRSAAAHVEDVSRELRRTNDLLSVDGTFGADLRGLSEKASGIERSVEDGVKSADAMRGGVDGVRDSLARDVPVLLGWSAQAQDRQFFAQLPLEEKKPATLSLTWLEGHRVLDCVLTLAPPKIGREVSLPVTKHSCSRSVPPELVLRPGEATPVGELPFEATAIGIDRRVGRNRAMLRIVRRQLAYPTIALTPSLESSPVASMLAERSDRP